jgi:UDP-N-acetylglucosamine 1-carboxyvinyltransferase
MNGTFCIRGGNALRGSVKPILNKNSLLGALPAAVLECEQITYHNLPATTDVECFLDIYKDLGARIEKGEDGLTSIDCRPVGTYRVNSEIARRIRGSFMLVGPLLSRFGVAEVPLPGGCKLGARSVSVHVNAFRSLGVTVEENEGIMRFTAPKRLPERTAVWLLEASVTATLNVAMFAAGAGIEVEIVDASCEPHVVDVLRLLEDLGATIEGVGTNHLVVHGKKQLGSADFTASPDHVDIAGYCVAAGVTGGEIRILDANLPRITTGMFNWMRLFGLEIEGDGRDVVVTGRHPLTIAKDEFPMAGKDLPKFSVRPWPGFPVDILPVMVTLACKAEGSVLFQNWMYESGFDFVRELNYLGAEIYTSDPQKIIVMDPVVQFSGGEVAAPGIIQGTKAIFLAALSDDVETIVHGTNILRRRYPDIYSNYSALGAKIACAEHKEVQFRHLEESDDTLGEPIAAG